MNPGFDTMAKCARCDRTSPCHFFEVDRKVGLLFLRNEGTASVPVCEPCGGRWRPSFVQGRRVVWIDLVEACAGMDKVSARIYAESRP